MRMARRWAGESSRCEDPAPTVGRGRGGRFGSFAAVLFQDAGGIWITTRRAASLRPPRNGRIGFKPPYSKREPRRKARGAIVY